MVTVNYDDTGVEIEYCPQCKGTWLDKGEFANIISALQSEAANMSVPDYVKASLAEAKEMITGPKPFISEWRDFMTILRMFQYRFFVEHPDLQNKVIGIQKGFR
jgi:Zn-finger nucleic acid-binding protein